MSRLAAATFLILAAVCAVFATQHRFRVLSPAEMKEDVSLMRRALTELHPGLYRYNSREEFEKRFEELEGKLGRPLGEDRFFILVSQFLSEVRCGHTYVNPYNQKKDLLRRFVDRKTYFPFYFEFIDGEFIVTANASDADLPVGSAIHSINGVGIDEIVNTLMTVTTADGEGTYATRFESLGVDRESGPSYSLFDIYFPLFFPLKGSEFAIEATNFKTMEEVRLSVPAMTKVQRTAAMEERYGKSPGYDDGWNLSYPAKGTGYLRIDNFITWKLSFDYRKFLAGAFEDLNAKGARNLIIDIRNSDGGDSTITNELLRYLKERPFACRSSVMTYIRTAKADPGVMKHAGGYDSEVIDALTNGVPEEAYRKADNGLLEYLVDSGGCEPVEPYKHRFSGKVFLLIGPANQSAAFTMADRFKAEGAATLVGRPTGGNLNGFNGGTYVFLTLPNSEIEFDIPVFAYFPADPAAARDSGVTPDIRVPVSAGDIGESTDRALKRTLKMIGEQNTPRK